MVSQEFFAPTQFGGSDSGSVQAKAYVVRHSATKRTFDIIGVIGLGLFFLPAILCIVLLIAIDSPGPILFRQTRYGAGKSIFQIYKFRTMRWECASPFSQVAQEDRRVTRVGWWLRRSCLDELPQLLNVIRGEMSLVGPRPHVVEMDEALAPGVPGYWDRYLVKPGLTGLAQARGVSGPLDSLAKVNARVALDLAYINSWSVWLDLRIFLLTPRSILNKAI